MSLDCEPWRPPDGLDEAKALPDLSRSQCDVCSSRFVTSGPLLEGSELRGLEGRLLWVRLSVD